MGLLDRFEQRVDRAVNGAFAKAFKSNCSPWEIAAALQNEMDPGQRWSAVLAPWSPTVYTVHVSQEDYDRLSVTSTRQLVGEFAVMIRDYAAQQQYSFLGSVTVSMQPAPDRPQGTVEIVSEARVDHDVAPAAGPAAAVRPRPREQQGHLPLNRRSPASAGESMPTFESRTRAFPVTTPRSGWARRHPARPGIDQRHHHVNGTLVAECPLRDGAVVTIGSTNLTFRSSGERIGLTCCARHPDRALDVRDVRARGAAPRFGGTAGRCGSHPAATCRPAPPAALGVAQTGEQPGRHQWCAVRHGDSFGSAPITIGWAIDLTLVASTTNTPQ